jgi:hypothetical protein
LGIKDLGSNGFSNNADEITVAYTHFVTTVIQPDQQWMLKTFDMLIKLFGADTTLYIEPKRLFNENNEKIGEVAVEAIK